MKRTLICTLAITLLSVSGQAQGSQLIEKCLPTAKKTGAFLYRVGSGLSAQTPVFGTLEPKSKPFAQAANLTYFVRAGIEDEGAFSVYRINIRAGSPTQAPCTLVKTELLSEN
jgi:hypothetical protein